MGQEKECIIENNLIKDLIEMGYEYIPVKNELQLKENFRVQFEKLNHDKFETEPLTDAEFERLYTDITRQLNKETYPIYEAAEMLRQPYVFMRDNGSSVYLSFLSQDLDKNTYQVANQITVHTDGGKKNRFDVTLLINGLPLVQIELKRSKVEVTKAITQVDDYNKNSYQNLFYFTQLLICSNGERTVYAANIDTINIDTKSTQISYSEWMDEKNNPCEYAKLSNFTPKFLDRCFITKFIWNYEILDEIKNNEDATELFDELLEKAIKYTEIRAKWNLMNGSERAEADAGRTMCHDSLIVKFNQLAKYLRINGKSAGWRDQLGYDDSDRKRIGDFAVYIVFVSCLNAR